MNSTLCYRENNPNWVYPPVKHPIIELILTKQFDETKSLKNIGHLVFNNGVQNVIFPNRLDKTQDLKFGSILKLTSINSSRKWFVDHLFWESLSNVKLLHVHGDWLPSELSFIISKCLNLKTVSFTYWKCSSIIDVLGCFQNSLDELTIDLFGSNDTVYDISVKLMQSLYDNGKLKRLMILTPESLPLDPMLELHNELKNVLEENATVIILFGQEDKMCSKLLKTKLNYHTAGYFIIAHNNELSDIDTPNKVFDQYELYKNQIDGRKFYIGCRFGWYGERQLMEKQVDLDCIDADDLFWTYSDGYKQIHFTATRLRDQSSLKDVTAPYVLPVFNHGTEHCCKNLVQTKEAEPYHRFGTPGFEQTKVQEIVFFFKNTEMYLTNGLITMLLDKKNESNFYKSWNGAKRLILRCTTYDRRAIIANGLREFLELVEHIEFAGNWWTELFTYFFIKFPDELRSWTMTRIALERNSLRDIMNSLPSYFFGRIEEFHFDGRNTNGDASMASILNALYKEETGFTGLKDLCLIANTYSSENFLSDIDRVLENTETITEDVASIMIVVFELVNESDLEFQEFEKNGHVLFPDMFSETKDVDYCGILQLFSLKDFGREWYLLQPK